MNNKKGRKNKLMRQKQTTEEQLTPEQQQERQSIIVIALERELEIANENHKQGLVSSRKHQNEVYYTNVKQIIERRAIEYGELSSDVSKVIRELYGIIVKEKRLCSRDLFYKALRSERFNAFKDMHKSKNASHPHKPRSSQRTQVSDSSSVTETESEPNPAITTNITETETETSTTTDKPLPQHILDARQAIDESNEIQSALGKLVKLLSGELTEEQSKRNDEDVGKTMQRKMVEQSADYLQMFVKRIPDGHFRSIKVSIGWASLLIEQFEEAITNETIIRKRKEEMTGV